MPIYEFRCCYDHEEEHFYHSWSHLPKDKKRWCETCGEESEMIMPQSVPLTYFEEGRAQVLYNLTGRPTEVRSFRQHEKLMKEHNRAPAYSWTQVVREMKE